MTPQPVLGIPLPLRFNALLLWGEATPPPPLTHPVITGQTFTQGAGGQAAEFEILGSYAGANTLDLYAVLGTDPITVSQAELIAGSGGTNTLEFFDVQGFSFASPFDITGLTSASEPATRIAYVIVERSNSGTTGVQTPADAITGLDFTPPAPPIVATNAAGDTLTLTFAEPVYGTQDLADFGISGVAAGTPTLDSVTGFGTSTLTLDISGALVANGDTVTLAYTNSNSNLCDANGERLANFSGLSVANNVPGAGITDPNDIATLYRWYDATDTGSITLAAGTTASAIADKTTGSSVSMSQALSGDRPDSGTDSVAPSHNVLFFGDGDLFEETVTDFPASGTLVFVAEILSANGNANDGLFSVQGVNDFQIAAGSSTQALLHVNSTSHTDFTSGTTDYVTTSEDVVIFVYRWDAAANTAQLYINGGAAIGTASDYTTDYSAAQTMQINANRAQARELSQNFVGLALYSTALSDTDVNSLGTYYAGLLTNALWSNI